MKVVYCSVGAILAFVLSSCVEGLSVGIIAVESVQEENKQLKAKLAQYESTPAQALKTVMSNFDIQIEAGTKGTYPIELSIMIGPNCIAETLDDYPILKAEDIDSDEQ